VLITIKPKNKINIKELLSSLYSIKQEMNVGVYHEKEWNFHYSINMHFPRIMPRPEAEFLNEESDFWVFLLNVDEEDRSLFEAAILEHDPLLSDDESAIISGEV